MHNHKIQTQHFTELQCNKLKNVKRGQLQATVIQMNKDNNGLMFLYPNVTC